MEITRGDIFIADLNPVQGSEQGGIRPVLVIQNDRGNRFSPTVICAAMTSRVGKSDLPTHAWVSARDSGLKCDSLVLCEQIRTLEKRRLRAKAGRIDGMAKAREDAAQLCERDKIEHARRETIRRLKSVSSPHKGEDTTMPHNGRAMRA